MARLLPLLLVLLLAGCVEVDERLVLGAEGGGRYELRLAWDAELLSRMNDLVGRRAAARFARGTLPLQAEAWRESLQGLPGLRAQRVTIEDRGEGIRVLEVRVAFERLEDLLGWEIFARRDLDLAFVDAEGDRVGDGDRDRAKGGDQARLRMRPLVRVVSLGRVLDALALWRAAPPRSAAGGLREPSAAERLGILPADGNLLADLLETHLAEAAFTFHVEVPGDLVEARGGEALGSHGRWRFDAQAVGQAGRGGQIELIWRPSAFDRVPRIDHPLPTQR